MKRLPDRQQGTLTMRVYELDEVENAAKEMFDLCLDAGDGIHKAAQTACAAYPTVGAEFVAWLVN